MRSGLFSLIVAGVLPLQGTIVPPTPAYPAASIAARAAGVAVADFRTDTEGRMVTVTVLEAPDLAIASAVHDALMRWNPGPSRILGQEDKPRPRTGTVIFYFVLADGTGKVLRPDQMPGGPPARRPSPRSSGPPPPRPTAAPAVNTAHGEALEEIDENALAALASTHKDLAVLDSRVREAFKRGHRDGAVNIPREELQIRGPIELRGRRIVVVDCTQDDIRWCRIAGSMLENKGFERVVLLGRR